MVLFCASGGLAASYLFPDITGSTGRTVSVKIVKLGKEDGQGVGYMVVGSMVVVNRSVDLIGMNVLAEVESIIPTSGGRMVFGILFGEDK